MNRLQLYPALALLLAVLPAAAEEKRATVAQASSQSTSSSSHTDASGRTVTITTTERDGKRETRRTVTGPDGKVLSETTGDGAVATTSSQVGGPWLGVHTAELLPALREQLDLPASAGLLVEQLPPDSPAANAGIAQNDILLTLNLTPVATPEQLRTELAKFQPGEKVNIEYLHKARREKAAVTLGKRGNPQDPNAAPPAPRVKTAPTMPNATAKASARSSTRTVIVGSDGKQTVIETDGAGDPLASMLRDPNVPATMKESLRKMQEQMRDFQKRTEAASGGVPPVRKETQ